MKNVCIIFIFLGMTSCYVCRKAPIIIERPVYIPSTPQYYSFPRWVPRTHRDSLLWEASKKAKLSANAKNPMYR